MIAALVFGILCCAMWLPGPRDETFYVDPLLAIFPALVAGAMIMTFLYATRGGSLALRLIVICPLMALMIFIGWWNSYVGFNSVWFMISFFLNVIGGPVIVFLAMAAIPDRRQE
jgi:hypothetical protein